MSKNITLAVSDKLAAEMEKYPEVVWSKVAKHAIIGYISARKGTENKRGTFGDEYVCGVCNTPARSLIEGIAYIDKGTYLLNVHPECHPDFEQ